VAKEVQTAAKAATAGAATGAATAMEEAVTAGAATGVATEAAEAATGAGAATVMAEVAMAALERMSVLSAAAAYAAAASHSSTSRKVLNRAFYPTLNWASLAPPQNWFRARRCENHLVQLFDKKAMHGEGRGLHVR
jgi:hypothetical protein